MINSIIQFQAKHLTLFEKATLLFCLNRMEPYEWQEAFLKKWLKPAHELPEVWWKQVLKDVDGFTDGDRQSGRTTALAILLAVDDSLPDWWPFPWFTDHWPYQEATEMLRYKADEYRCQLTDYFMERKDNKQC